MMQGNKKQAKNTSNNFDFSYSLLETRIKEARNTSNNDFSFFLLFMFRSKKNNNGVATNLDVNPSKMNLRTHNLILITTPRNKI